MKKNLLLFCLIALPIISYSQWTLLSSGTTQDLNSVCFVDSNIGYVGGSKGVLKTVNGGTNWVNLSGAPGLNSAYVKSVYFVDDNIGYILTDVDGILKTTNGGTSWTSIFYDWGLYLELYSVCFINADTGFVGGNEGYDGVNGYGGYILKTTNGGITWSSQVFENTDEIYSFCFIDSNKLYAIGSDNIYVTSNLGLTWTKQLIDSCSQCSFKTLSFSNEDTGYIAESNTPSILKTFNGGHTWTVILKDTIPFNYVHFKDANNGCVIGNNGMILGTTNGGRQWNEIKSGTSLNLNSMYFVNSNNGFIVGNGGIILKTTNGGTKIAQLQQDGSDNLTLFPDPVKTILHLTRVDQNSLISIYDLQGILLINCQNSDNQINVSNLHGGEYIIRISDNHKIITSRFIKE